MAIDIETLQAQYDDLANELKKAKEIAANQKIRAEKAELKLKETATIAEPIKSVEIDELKQKLQIEIEKNNGLKTELTNFANTKKESDITLAISKNGKIKPDLIDIVNYGLASKTTVQNGKTVVLKPDGNVKLSPKTGQPMLVDELLEEMLEEKKSLMIAATDGGNGDGGNNNSEGNLISSEEYKAMDSAERAKYRESLSDEESQELYNT